jgi:fructosamine-3-kinase
MNFISDKLKPITRPINRKIDKIYKNFTAEKRIENLRSRIEQNIADLNRQSSKLHNDLAKENNYWTH